MGDEFHVICYKAHGHVAISQEDPLMLFVRESFIILKALRFNSEVLKFKSEIGTHTVLEGTLDDKT